MTRSAPPAEMPRAMTQPVTRRLMPILSALLGLLVIGAMALFWQQHRTQEDAETTAWSAETKRDFDDAIAKQAAGLALALQPLAADVRVQQALRTNNAARLKEDWRGLFETLKLEYKLTHFYFLDRHRKHGARTGCTGNPHPACGAAGIFERRTGRLCRAWQGDR